MGFRYRLVINKENRKSNVLHFTYRSTKDIEMSVNRNSAMIDCVIGKKYESIKDQYLLSLFREAVKKCSLIHLIKYEKTIVIKTVHFYAFDSNGNMIAHDDVTALFPLFQLLNRTPRRKISDSLKTKAVLQRIVGITKTNQKHSISALYSYLCAKYDEFETDRFMHNWMAFNGIYSELSDKKQECQKIDDLLKICGIDYQMLNKAQRDDICSRVLLLAKQLNIKKEEDIYSEEVKIRLEKILNATKYQNGEYDIYGFFLADFTYMLRCQLFHADNPILLFAFKNDWELKALELANVLLEKFLDETISTLFYDSNEGGKL